MDKEVQEASSQRKVSPISTYFLSSLILNFQRIFYTKIRLSDWINEGSELIEAHLEVKVVQSEYFFIDSEEETSDAEVEEEIFMEEADEPQDDDASDDDDDGEENEAEKPTEAESGASSSSKGPKEKKVKVPKSNRNYIADPKETFILVDLSDHPQKLEPPVFSSNGSGRNSILMFKDKNP